MLRSLARITTGLALALACSTCARPDEATLVLEFRHQLGGQALALGEDRTTRYGHEVRFDHLRYWVSNVSLGDSASGDVHAIPDSYYLIEQTPERTRVELTLECRPAAGTRSSCTSASIQSPTPASTQSPAS
ncbi:MAG: hypothetical protein HC927_07660 [Deltaproteobacteria bacterium]|nr:hypothetical protein [Deltaproteobacteria bacterium]